MQAVYVCEPDCVDLVAERDIEAGEVLVRGELVLVATSPIPAGCRGGFRRKGGFAMPKATAEEIPLGTRVFVNAELGVVAATAFDPADPSAGVTLADAKAGSETVLVALGD